MSDTAAKKETAEAKRARAQRQERQLREKRNQQLSDTQKALRNLKEHLRSTRSKRKQGDALSSHSKGFYEEINKLVKGKLLIGVTDLAVEQANDIIRDAKEIIKKDVHLERIKEFVPAGDNPVYPDVLLTIRSVRDSLDRSEEELENRVQILVSQIEKAQTVIGALEYFLDDEAEQEEDEDKNYPTKSAIEAYVEGSISDLCFSQFADTHERYFDFVPLDRQSLEEYLSPPEDDEEAENADGPDGVDEADSSDEFSAEDEEDPEEKGDEK